MIQIGDQTFEVPAPPAMKSFALQQRIVPIAGRIVGVISAVVGKDEKFDILGMDSEKLGAIGHLIGDVFAGLPDGELEAVTRKLLEHATVSGWGGANNVRLFDGNGGGAFDGVMKGRTLDTWVLLWHALQVWYPDFIQRLAGKSKGGGAKESRSET